MPFCNVMKRGIEFCVESAFNSARGFFQFEISLQRRKNSLFFCEAFAQFKNMFDFRLMFFQ